MFNLNLIDESKLAGVLENCNMDPETWYPSREYVAAGDELTFYLPLIGTYLSDHYFANIQGDIVLDFVPANSLLVSGDVTVDCTSMSLIVETENLTAEDERSHQSYHSQVISSNRLLEWVPVEEFSRTLTANSTYNIDLDSVVGKCAGFVLLVKDTGATNANNKQFEYVDLGDTAKIDFVTSGGKSILGSGVPIDAKYLREEVWASHFSTKFSRQRNAYFIPFTNDGKNALHGVVDGYVSLNSSGHKLQIKPSASGTSAVQLLQTTFGSALDSGYYRLEFRGERTDALSYTTSAAAIKTALENLSTFKAYEGQSLTVTVSDDLSASATVSLTFPSGVDVQDKVTVISEGLTIAGGLATVLTPSKPEPWEPLLL
jgi:hypothetical protein